MALTGRLTLILAILLWLGSVGVTLAVWTRGSRTGAVRWARRAGLVAVCQLTAVALVAVMINDANSFYSSWRELLGEHHRVTTTAALPGQQDAVLTGKLHDAGMHGQGLLVPVRIPGPSSHLPALHGYVYLPPQYGSPAFAKRDFPVIELLAGSPGTPRTWQQGMHIESILNSEIASGRAEPFVAVIPDVDVAGGRDTECLNIARGPQVETYLTSDVRAMMTHNFRVGSQGRDWSVMGYSSGGYCAINLAMRHPDLFTSAVSIAGYDRPYQDAQTGNLFGKDAQARNLNTPIWRATHLPLPDISVLMLASAEDPGTTRSATELSVAARSPMSVTRITLRHGGHNFEVWRAELPVALAWLSRQLPPPLAPEPVIDGVRPITTTG